MSPLSQPSLSAWFLLTAEDGGRSGPRDLGLPGRLGLGLVAEQPGHSAWSGTLGSYAVELDWSLAHDTHLLRLTLRGQGDERDWPALRQKLDQIEAEERPAQGERPWAVTYLYHAALPGRSDFSQARAALSAPECLGLSAEQVTTADATPFGWLWELTEGPLTDAGREPWQRTLALITPADRLAKVRDVFLDPGGQGLARIELYLQKAEHHSRLGERARGALGRARVELQEGMLATLHAPETGSPRREQRQLEEISRRLMRFLIQKAQIEVLLNSLRANLSALREHRERVKFSAGCYERRERALERELEQLEVDLRNAQSVAESTYSFQDIQRGAEANALQRASYLMGAMAALLAGVTIYGSFLDLWSVALDGTLLTLPPVALRMTIGLLAGITWPLAAYFAVMRRLWPAIVSFLVGLVAVALAVAATLLFN